MATATINGARMHYSLTGGAGSPLVLVHGSWGDHRDWDPVVSAFAGPFRVGAHDRRGHGQSERPSGQGSAEEDAADLSAPIEFLGHAPARVAGLSFGGSISLRLAARRPDLNRSLAVQEPPLFDLLIGDPPLGALLRDVLGRIREVAVRLTAGETEGGTRQSMETVAFGPGRGSSFRRTSAGRASTTLRPTWMRLATRMSTRSIWPRSPPSVLLTHGDQSPTCFPPVVAKLATILPRAEQHVFAKSGHVQPVSHPVEYVSLVSAFAAAADSS
jgi:pimeloyl-ACP methyl ester carboxylesterase